MSAVSLCIRYSTTFSTSFTLIANGRCSRIMPSEDDPRQKEITHYAVYHHYRKWSKDGSLEKIWQGSILAILDDFNLSELNFDGTHTIAKKGGESVAIKDAKKKKPQIFCSLQIARVLSLHVLNY